VVFCVFYGPWMSVRVARHWPIAKQLSGPNRERVARAARRGDRIADPALVPALTGYRDGLHKASEEFTLLRWLVWFVLVVAVVMAVWDAAFGSWGNAIVSAIYLVVLVIDMFWWPKRQRQLLANADTAAVMARDVSK
jgi:Flp pilus assembly protein TadB